MNRSAVILVLVAIATSASTLNPFYQPKAPDPGYTVIRAIKGGESSRDGEHWYYYSQDAPEHWEEMLPYAAAHWKRKPDCKNGVRMRTGHFTAAKGSAIIATADVNGCDIAINVPYMNGVPTRWARCSFITHEYAHLLGYKHSDGEIMSQNSCSKWFSPPAQGQPLVFGPLELPNVQ